MALYWIAGFGLTLAYFTKGAAALQCYDCISTKVGSLESNPECEYAPVTSMGKLPTTMCPVGQVCGAIRGKVGIGFAESGIVIRSCIAKPSFNGDCAHNPSSQILSSFSQGSLFGFDGDVCFCVTPLCSAGPCRPDMIKVFGYCVHLIMAVPIFVLLFLYIYNTREVDNPADAHPLTDIPDADSD